jgi:hypothetical protein
MKLHTTLRAQTRQRADAVARQFADTPTQQRANTPTCGHTNLPTYQHTDAPTRQRANMPTRQCADTPTRRRANAPTHQHASADAPTRRHTNAPTHQRADAPSHHHTNASDTPPAPQCAQHAHARRMIYNVCSYSHFNTGMYFCIVSTLISISRYSSFHEIEEKKWDKNCARTYGKLHVMQIAMLLINTRDEFLSVEANYLQDVLGQLVIQVPSVLHLLLEFWGLFAQFYVVCCPHLMWMCTSWWTHYLFL